MSDLASNTTTETHDLSEVGARAPITITDDRSKLCDDTIDALADHPEVFSRGTPAKLVRVEQGIATELRPESLIDVASRYAVFLEQRTTKSGDVSLRPRALSDSEAKSVLARTNHGSIRRLAGVVRTPRLLRDGRLICEPGYDEPSQIFFEPERAWPKMIEQPTRQDACAAYKRLAELFNEFEFVDPEWSIAACVGCMLTLQARYIYDGAAPLFVLNGSVAGAGKGLLARVLITIGYGSKTGSVQYGEDAEMRKLIYAEVARGKEVLLLDNVAKPLGGPAIASAVTEPLIGGRMLQRSETGHFENRLTIIATGINVRLRGDEMLRRVIDIRQEPTSATPHMREFRRDLDAYVTKHQTELTADVITILRAYLLAGAPKQQLRALSGFTEWSRIVRGALVWVGAPDLQRAAEHQTTVTAEHEAAVALASAWVAAAKAGKAEEYSARDVCSKIKECANGNKKSEWYVLGSAIVECLDDRTQIEQLNAQRIGGALAALEGRRLTVDGKIGRFTQRVLHGTKLWKWNTNNCDKPRSVLPPLPQRI